MAKPSERLDQLAERLDLENYGIGIPFSFFAVGGSALYWSFGGLTSYNSLSEYGQFGVIVGLAVSILFFIAAGWTYNEIDKGWWVAQSEDAPKVTDNE